MKGGFTMCETTGSVGFAPRRNRDMRPDFLKRLPNIGCDMPEQGGISGNIRLDEKPNPWVKEERPSVINPITGDRVYLDTLLKCNDWLA